MECASATAPNTRILVTNGLFFAEMTTIRELAAASLRVGILVVVSFAGTNSLNGGLG